MPRFVRLALASAVLVGVTALVPGGAAGSGRAAARAPRGRADRPSVLGFWAGKEAQENPAESYDVRLHISRLHSDKVDGVIQYSGGYPDPVDCTATLRRTGANVNEGSWTFRETLINDLHGNCIAAIDKVKPTGTGELSLTSTYPGFAAAASGTLTKKQDPSTFALDASQQAVTWTEYCGRDWCTEVSFKYLLQGNAFYDRIDEPKDSLPASYSFTRVDAEGILFRGHENGWGLEVRPIITRIALNEDWEGLPCLSPSPHGVPFHIRPTSNPVHEDYVETFTTSPGFWQSLADPQLEVDGEGLLMNPGPVNTRLTFQLGFDPATAGLGNGPCEATSQPEGLSAARAVDGAVARHSGARVPGLRIDGFKVAHRVVASQLGIAAKLLNAPKRAVRTKRAAIALLTLDRLVDVQARSRNPVSQARLAKLLDGLVSDYNANPAAAAAAGIELGPGQTPEDYFTSQANHYRVLATRGALWNGIVHGAKRPAQRTRRLAAFLRHELRHHHVRVTGLRSFSLPSALPPVL